MSHKKRKVKNKTNPKGNVNSNPADLQNIVYLDFTKHSKWTETVNIKGFTNCLKSPNEASRHFLFIVDQLIPDIQSYGMDILSNNAPHCHALTGDARKKAIKVIDTIYNGKVETKDSNIWELGAKTEEIRLIGMFVNDTVKRFYPLFIDHHHLLYPDMYYNQPDYKHYHLTKKDITQLPN